MQWRTMCVVGLAVTVAITTEAQTVIQPNTSYAINGTPGSQRLYQFSVPSGVNSVLEVTSSGGSGDCDLYLKKGAPPTTSSYQARSNTTSSNEKITVADSVAGTWYLLVRGSTSYANVRLAVALPGRRWDFNESGGWWVPPAGWRDASQDLLSTPTCPYGYGLRSGTLAFGTRPGLRDRFKVITTTSFRTGKYSFRLWIPPIDAQDQGTGGTIGAFLYSAATANSRPEIDVEIGWGRLDHRNRFKAGTGQLVAYFLVQPYGTEPGNGALGKMLGAAVVPNNWYTFVITTTTSSRGTINVAWQYARASDPLSKAITYESQYPATTDFWILASLENNPWTALNGNDLPKKPRFTQFDWISFQP